MPSTAKAEATATVNKQPPPSLAMSTDPNALKTRAMRLRGGCFVRYSSAVPIPIPYTFSRNATSPVGAAI